METFVLSHDNIYELVERINSLSKDKLFNITHDWDLKDSDITEGWAFTKYQDYGYSDISIRARVELPSCISFKCIVIEFYRTGNDIVHYHGYNMGDVILFNDGIMYTKEPSLNCGKVLLYKYRKVYD